MTVMTAMVTILMVIVVMMVMLIISPETGCRFYANLGNIFHTFLLA